MGESLPWSVVVSPYPARDRFGLDRNLWVGSPPPSGGGAESHRPAPWLVLWHRPNRTGWNATEPPGHPPPRAGGDALTASQATSPGTPFWLISGRPAACQASIPPSTFTAS